MEIAEFVLESAGANVIKAFNGKEALEIFKESKLGEIDIILMDVMMPVMDGLEAARYIRWSNKENARDIPIIAMTANAFTEDRRRVLEAGMNEHLSLIHISEPTRRTPISYAVFCLKKKKKMTLIPISEPTRRTPITYAVFYFKKKQQ